MAQIKEAYVSFDTAKLLKEKGFNEDCYTCYVTDEIQHYDYKSRNSDLINGVISAPTQQMAMRWLREVNHLYIMVDFNFSRYKYKIFSSKGLLASTYYVHATYELAVENAINYCLTNLI